jgi:MFS family permease
MAGSPQKQHIRASAAAFVGTMIEWYDFYIYGTASALVFGQLFFPTQTAFIGTLASFATFAVGFFARPLGAIVFGHLGDKIGRKKTLIATLLIMGTVTICIGLLPTYETVGIWAPIMLVFLRILQGIAVGGEWGGAVLIAGEHAPKGRRTFFASFAQLGSPAALIVTLLAFRAATAMPKEAFLSWGWRVPFLASVVMLVVGLLIRLGVKESPEFERLRDSQKIAEVPVIELLQTAWRRVALAIAANALGIAGFYFTSTFMIAFTTQYLGLARELVLDCLFVVAICQFCGQPIAALMAEKVGETRFLLWTAGLSMLTPYFMFALVDTKITAIMIIGIATSVVIMASFYAVMAGFVSGTFPTRVRYSGISLAYQFSGATFGGLTPLIGTVLAEQFKGHWWPLAIFYTVIAGSSFLGVLALIRMNRRETGYLEQDLESPALVRGAE